MKLKIKIQKKYDRIIFISKQGINYHQGIEDIDLTFAVPCSKLTEIYNKIKLRGDKKPINKAIYVFECLIP